MLVCVDLDDTLVPQKSAFREWAVNFCLNYDRGDDYRWLVETGRNGSVSHRSLANELLRRWDLFDLKGLTSQIRSTQLETLIAHADMSVTKSAITAVRDQGAAVVIVTNGATDWQLDKIHGCGLNAVVDACIISNAVGARKPARQIFKYAASGVGADWPDWVLGDNPATDITGGRRCGAKTGWVSGGRVWPVRSFEPTVIAPTAAEIFSVISELP